MAIGVIVVPIGMTSPVPRVSTRAAGVFRSSLPITPTIRTVSPVVQSADPRPVRLSTKTENSVLAPSVSVTR